MTDLPSRSAPPRKSRRWLDRERLSVLLIALGCVVLLLGGSLVYPGFLKPGYILQQLQIAAFLGIIATGAMLVILLGEIDLSVPWTITGTAIVVISVSGNPDPMIAGLAIPLGLCFGMAVGLLNAIGVAVFHVPAMVWTLAVNAMLLGTAVFYTGNTRPNGEVPWLATQAAIGRTFGVPNAFLVWLVVALVMIWVLKRTVYGSYLYALGNSRRAVFLAGARVHLVTVATFVLAGLFSSFGAILLLGYTNQAYQGMGDPYLMPVISAVVIGGTSILGGRGNYVGTIAGAIFITILSSILSLMQMPAAARQIIFGAIILVMLLVHSLTGKDEEVS